MVPSAGTVAVSRRDVRWGHLQLAESPKKGTDAVDVSAAVKAARDALAADDVLTKMQDGADKLKAAADAIGVDTMRIASSGAGSNKCSSQGNIESTTIDPELGSAAGELVITMAQSAAKVSWVAVRTIVSATGTMLASTLFGWDEQPGAKASGSPPKSKSVAATEKPSAVPSKAPLWSSPLKKATLVDSLAEGAQELLLGNFGSKEQKEEYERHKQLAELRRAAEMLPGMAKKMAAAKLEAVALAAEKDVLVKVRQAEEEALTKVYEVEQLPSRLRSEAEQLPSRVRSEVEQVPSRLRTRLELLPTQAQLAAFTSLRVAVNDAHDQLASKRRERDALRAEVQKGQRQLRSRFTGE